MFSFTVVILNHVFTLKLQIALKKSSKKIVKSSICPADVNIYWDKWAEQDNTLKFKRKV